MPINGPKGAHPTSRGWVSSRGELLKSQRITEDQIAEWDAAMNPKPVKKSKPKVLKEAPTTEEEVIDELFVDDIVLNEDESYLNKM